MNIKILLKLYIGEDADYILNGTTRRIAINSGAPKMSEKMEEMDYEVSCIKTGF